MAHDGDLVSDDLAHERDREAGTDGRVGEDDSDQNGNRRGRGELAAVSRGSVGRTGTLKPALIPC
jgi:hypothetical protein